MASSQSMFERYNRRAAIDLRDGLEGRKTCRFCGAERTFATKDIGIGIPVGYPFECECVNKLYQQARAKQREERHSSTFERRVEAARIPPLFRTATTTQALQSLYIFGQSGTGKTLMACALLMQALREGMTALYATTAWLTAMNFDDREEAFERMRRVDVLCIDDLGKAETSQWSNALAFRAVDERYGTGKMLIVTSNYAPSTLASVLERNSNEQTARATVSRLCEMTKRLELEGQDKRLAGNEERKS